MTRSAVQARVPPRLAPPGTRPPEPRPDRPPDGWSPLKPSRRDRIWSSVDAAVLRLADGVARGLTRRQFLKRAGQAGLVLALSTTNLLWHTGTASADPCTGPCGPSPLCSNTKCSSGNCNLSVSGVKRRVNANTGVHEGYACGSNTANNCWVEDCCSRNGSFWNCCDCCVSGTQAPLCTPNCSKHACICRTNLHVC